MDGTLDRRTFDRRVYGTAAIVFALVVLAGFARTYYLRGLFASPPLASTVVHLHGLVMTAWVILFVVQVRLISSNRLRLHRRMGYAGIGLAVLVVAIGSVTALRSAKYGSASPPPDISPLGFLIVPLFDLVMFVIFFGSAISYRRRPAAHKRLMLLTAINFLPPALARIPVTPLQSLGPLWFFGFPTACALLCLWLDARGHGRVNRIFATGIVALVTSYVVRMAVMSTDAWMATAAWLTSFV